MGYERPPGVGQGQLPEPLPAATSGVMEGDAGPAIAVRLQILSTEHWSLLASRSLAWNESFSRAAMFLSTVTGAIVALALVAQVSDLARAFASSRSSSSRLSSASERSCASASPTATTPCA